MSDVQDMTSQMAKELMLGIRDNVEDIAESFKKMAIINPERHKPKAAVEAVPPTRITPKEEPQTGKTIIVAKRSYDPEKAARFEALVEAENSRKRFRRKTIVDENQLSLFEVA